MVFIKKIIFVSKRFRKILAEQGGESNGDTPMTLRVASTTKLYMRWETYRAEADECRRMATKALDPIDRERWLRVAEQWLDLIPRPLNGCERNQGIDSARNRQAGQ